MIAPKVIGTRGLMVTVVHTARMCLHHQLTIGNPAGGDFGLPGTEVFGRHMGSCFKSGDKVHPV